MILYASLLFSWNSVVAIHYRSSLASLLCRARIDSDVVNAVTDQWMRADIDKLRASANEGPSN